MKNNENKNNMFELDVEDIKFSSRLQKEEKEEIKEALQESDKRSMMRFLCDQYYQAQSMRIQSENRARALAQGYDNADQEHALFIQRMLKNAKVQEALALHYIEIATDSIPVCRWMKSIKAVGPVTAGVLYHSLDINRVQYATEFLSYCGLNDNNNKWLGIQGAKDLTKEAVEYREKLYVTVQRCLDGWIKDVFDSNLDKKRLEMFYKKCFTQMFQKNEYADINEIAEKIYKKICVQPYTEYLQEHAVNWGLVPNVIRWVEQPKYCDGTLITYVAYHTTRKFANVKKGVIATWESKKQKTKYAQVSDLEKYLAKPPYNPDLKKFMYLIGDCFVKNSNRGSMYGEIYKRRLEEEQYKNEQRAFKDQAAALLAEKNFDKNKDTYKYLADGKLSPAHIIMRARRYAVKLFISHVFEGMYYLERGEEPPKYYTIEIQGHHDYIAPEVDYRKFAE